MDGKRKNGGHGVLILGDPLPQKIPHALNEDLPKTTGQDESEIPEVSGSSLPRPKQSSSTRPSVAPQLPSETQKAPRERNEDLPKTTDQGGSDIAKAKGSSLPRGKTPSSSGSSVVSHYCAPLSSSHNTRGVTVTCTGTAATTVSDAVKNANTNHSSTDQDELTSVASSTDEFYPTFANVLGNNLRQDLKGVDLAHFENKSIRLLEEFSLRFGNENGSANHLRMMSIVYRHSRYELLVRPC